jgi:hypothetical protein
MKPAFKTLRDDMQIIYLDLAGADRSNGVSRCLKALAPLADRVCPNPVEFSARF